MGISARPLWHRTDFRAGGKRTAFSASTCLIGFGKQACSRQLAIGAVLGYGRFASWVFLIFPLIYHQIRLPVIAVLVFSLSVVDMALLLGPSLPPPLAILVLNGFNDANLAARLPASFGAIWQIGLALVALFLWRLIERLFGAIIRILSLARLAGTIS